MRPVKKVGKFPSKIANDMKDQSLEDQIKEAVRILKKGGFLIITAPNLASLANRFSLLFGFAPTNYHPSEIRHGTLFGAKQSSWHKSVFTVSAMKGFLKQHGFRPAVASGFNYRENFLLGFLPDNWKEGMIVFAERK